MGKNKEFRINEDTNEVYIGGQGFKLTPKEMGVLLLLNQHNGHTVSRSELLQEVWGDKYANNQGLTQAISRLREVFSKSDKIVIKTIPKKGYQLQKQSSKPMHLHLGTIKIKTNRLVVVLLILLIYILVFVKRISIQVAKAPVEIEESSIRESQSLNDGNE